MTAEGGSDAVLRALRRVEAVLFSSPVLEAVLARRESGRSRPADEGHALALARALCEFHGEDGSWGGDLVRTAEALLLLHALRSEPDHGVAGAVEAGVAWIRSLQGRSGAFAVGCTPERHALRFCEHFITGFFSPAPPDVDLSSLTVASGVRFGGDVAARLGASCLALRALLRWQAAGYDIEAHVDGVRVIVTGVALNAPSLISVAAYVSAVGALAEAPHTPREDAAVAAGLERLAGLQRADGSWRGVDPFHVLETMLLAAERGHHSDAADAAIGRAAGMLAVLQREDGSWGRETSPDRTLTGWRTLRHVAVRDH
jgi:hypothetical protein